MLNGATQLATTLLRPPGEARRLRSRTHIKPALCGAEAWAPGRTPNKSLGVQSQAAGARCGARRAQAGLPRPRGTPSAAVTGPRGARPRAPRPGRWQGLPFAPGRTVRHRRREGASRRGPAPSPAPGPPLPLAPGSARTRPRCPARPERRLRESGRRRPSAAPRAAAGLGGAARPPRPGRRQRGHRGAGRPEPRRGPARARAPEIRAGRRRPPPARLPAPPGSREREGAR